MKHRVIRAVAASASLAILAACAPFAGQGAGFAPASMRAQQQNALASGSKTLLYATTLDWNAGTGAVYVYDAYASNSRPLKVLQLSQGFPEGIWTNSRGDVYVAVVNAGPNGLGYIAEYTPGLGKLLRTYTSGVSGPSGGVFDSAGNMYVSNLCGPGAVSCSVFARTRGPINSQNGYVAIYPAGKMRPAKMLQTGINIAAGVTRDAAGNLFVVNNTGTIAWNVIEFPAGSTIGRVVAFQKIPKQRWVGAVTIDGTGALVVSINSTLDFFPSEHGQWSHQLTSGVYYVDGMAYGPDGTLFAGNYEFEQNEGNVIAFPPGSTSPARSFAVPYGSGITGTAVGASAASS